jgi:hypothetical protein
MSKEKWNFPESSAEHRPNQTSAVEVEFGRTVTRVFEHLRLARSGEISVPGTNSPFEISSPRVD